MKKILSTLLGLVVALTWWTIRGDRSPPEEQLQGLPAKVWDGGGGTLAIEVDATTDATLSIDFHERRDGGRNSNAREKVAPGPHSWSIEIPPNTGGYIEFEADAPQPGAKLSWTIRRDGRNIDSDEETLNQPLGRNEAFFLQEYYDDYSKAVAREEAAAADENADD